MEHGVVGGIDGVAPVHVPRHQKVPLALPQHAGLVGRRVAPQHRVLIHVVRVVGGAGHVVRGDKDLVKVLGEEEGVDGEFRLG